MLSVAIVEDDAQDARTLTDVLERYRAESKVEISVARFRNAEELLTNYKPVYDVIFMDIMLGVSGLNGMNAARRLREYDSEVALIFTTSMMKFAIQGYEVNALDYLIKPVDYYKIKLCIDRIVRTPHADTVYLNLKINQGTKRISSEDIVYIEVINHTLYYHTTEGVFSVRGNLSATEKTLSGHGFARSSIGHLVNLKYFKELRGTTLKIGDTELKITRGQQKKFMEKLTLYLNGMGGV